jgi:hypothetical protein
MQSKGRKSRSTGQVGARSKRAATVERDRFGITTVTIKGKSRLVTVFRSSRTGRFTTSKSADVIDRGAERFAGTLKRLATK